MNLHQSAHRQLHDRYGSSQVQGELVEVRPAIPFRRAPIPHLQSAKVEEKIESNQATHIEYWNKDYSSEFQKRVLKGYSDHYSILTCFGATLKQDFPSKKLIQSNLLISNCSASDEPIQRAGGLLGMIRLNIPC